MSNLLSGKHTYQGLPQFCSIRGAWRLHRYPRTLIITSCSDTKAQPAERSVKQLVRALQKQLRADLKEAKRLETEVGGKHAAPHTNDQELELLQRGIRELRERLVAFVLLEDDFTDANGLKIRELELSKFLAPAADMYEGAHHLDVMAGIKALRDCFGPTCVDLKIVSAGYGVLSEHDPIVPYEATFTGMDPDRLDERSRALNIHSDLEEAIKPYDLIIFLLGKEYLRAIHLPLQYDRDRQRLLFVASASSLPFLDYDPAYGRIMVGNDEVHDFSSAAVSLKGRVFRRFAEKVADQGWHLMGMVKEEPSRFMQLTKPGRKLLAANQLNLFECAAVAIKAANQEFSVTYFMPENEDRVDPHYDPWALLPQTRHDGARTGRDRYAHELLERAPYDGILVSLHKISRLSAASQNDIFDKGVHDYLRYYSGPVLGDCGAFTFDEHGRPPFNSREVLEQYRHLQFDMGVSVDYLIFPELWESDPAEAERRFNASLDEARLFWAAWQETHVRYPDWRFTPIGVAQGGTPDKFRSAVRELQAVGYRYIAIGGLARSPAPYIRKCLDAIAPVLHPDTQVHLFGFAKLEQAPTLRELGVTSFDSTSPLVQGFMRGVYWDPDMSGKQYAAIRVPFTDGKTAKRFSKDHERNLRESLRLEAETLHALRAYGDDPTRGSLIAARTALVEYDHYLHPWPYNSHIWASIETLEDQPWRRCQCPICREWGIAVVILRSNNHNRRRGFHNTWVFYQQKQKSLGPGVQWSPVEHM